MNSLFKMSILSTSLIALTACGGSSNEKKNTKPVVTSNIASSYQERSDVTISINATDADGTITSTNVVQISGPATNFIFNQGQLTFTAPEVAQDSDISFAVTATDDKNATSTQQLTTKIVHVNRFPVVDETPITIEFNQPTEFSVAVTDADNDPLTIILESTVGDGQLEHLGDSNFKFTPKLNNAVDQHFVIGISDGEANISNTITLKMVDTTSPVIIERIPAQDGEIVTVYSDVYISFDDVMNADTFTWNEDTQCSGSVQLSADNFATCLPIELTTTTGDELNFALNARPVNGLDASTNYSVKLTSAITNFHGVSLEETQFNFSTENKDLLISEVSSSIYSNDNRWLEVYNGTSNRVWLSDYQVVANSIDFNGYVNSGVRAFSLPDKPLEPGEKVVIQSKHGSQFWQSSVAQSEQLLLIAGEGDIRPAWYYSGGFVELQKVGGTTVDFVRFGESTQLPASADHWVGEGNAAAMEQELGMSIVRTDLTKDSNSASDWRAARFMTPGGDNDVTCLDDLDEDGIPDCAEQPGGTFAGLPLYEWGARVGVKDVFVEIDYMTSEDPGIQVHRQALDKVKAVFAEQGIAIHFDVGDLYHQAEGVSPEDYDLGGGNNIDFYAQTTFTSSVTAPSVIDHKINNFDIKRRPIFHYMLMANSQNADGSAGSSGYAELWGNDLMISMGNWGFSLETETSRNTLFNMQASTIVHELGHNFGLRHGGNDNLNYKPNHFSVMNYMYQLNGLSTIGDKEGDRYHRTHFSGNANCYPEGAELVHGFSVAPEQFNISYSHGKNISIDEKLVDESLGLGNTESLAVDFDCNGNSGDSLAGFDLNFDGNNSSTLNDYDEWGNLVLRFSREWNGTVSGESSNEHHAPRTSNVMNSDVQEAISEAPPSKALLKAIAESKHAKQ